MLKLYRDNKFDIENLKLVSKCLTLSPLDLTLWNYRMKIVLKNLSEDVIAKETEFVAMAMGINAKVYAIWEYNKFLVR